MIHHPKPRMCRLVCRQVEAAAVEGQACEATYIPVMQIILCFAAYRSTHLLRVKAT